MNKSGLQPILVCALIVVLGGAASAQTQGSYPMVDKLAAKVIAHYQSSSCQQLASQKQEQPTGEKAQMEQNAVKYLKQNPEAAQYFINKVAAPIATKLFQCGMIP